MEKERLKKAKASRRECERLGSHFFCLGIYRRAKFLGSCLLKKREVLKGLGESWRNGLCSFKCGVCRDTRKEKESPVVQPEALLFGYVLSFLH